MSDHFDRNVHRGFGKIDSPTIPSDTLFEEVIFHSSGNYCVCFADIAGSTLTINRINDGKDRANIMSSFLTVYLR